MEYELAVMRDKYRGMERSLTALDFYTPKTKRDYNTLLQEYSEVIEYELNIMTEELFDRMLLFYQKIKRYGIPCEIIVFDERPITEDLGYPVEFLGLDIVYDMGESLIEDKINPAVLYLLNENGLCRTEEDVEKVIRYQNHGTVEWKPCYVYKLLVDEPTMCINLNNVSAKDIFDKIVRLFDAANTYIFEICGADAEGFLDNLKSDNYLLIKDKKHLFLKDLELLFVLSKDLEDVKVFVDNIGQYNEGYMYFYILKDEFELCDRQQIFEIIQKNKLVTVKVEDDGDALGISWKSVDKMNLFLAK